MPECSTSATSEFYGSPKSQKGTISTESYSGAAGNYTKDGGIVIFTASTSAG